MGGLVRRQREAVCVLVQAEEAFTKARSLSPD